MGLKSSANIFISVHYQISQIFWSMIVNNQLFEEYFSTWIWLKMKAPPPKPPTTTPIAKPCFSWNTNVKPQPHSQALLKIFSNWRQQEYGNSLYFWGTRPSPSALWGWERCTGQRTRWTRKWLQPKGDSGTYSLFMRLSLSSFKNSKDDLSDNLFFYPMPVQVI